MLSMPTYKRPNRPQQLADYKQREHETDRDWLTRWTQTRNSCEGVEDSQAISWFANGCRHGSMLWQRLRRAMPDTLAETIRIADSYALGDPTLPSENEIPATYEAHKGAGTSGGQGPQDFRHKRNHERPAYRYNQVAAVEPDQPDAGNAQRQKQIGRASCRERVCQYV